MTDNDLSANPIFGQQVGRYVLLEKLGEGGMATVYNAYDSRLERNVALKMILPARQSSQMFLERFVREAKSLAQLSHTNIVKVLDYGEEAGVPYLVMEYIQGGMLKEVMNGPIPWAQAAAILAPIARALDYVHKQKIVHRDVKPSNILLDETDQPMLTDFGVVQLLQSTETIDMATGVGIGTPDYMSPEQGMGKDTDFRADIYALGVVYYELVTGQKPFTAETPMAVVIKHVTGSFPRPSSTPGLKLPPVIDEVVLKAVAKEPEERFQDMGIFAEVLEQLARGERANLKRIRKLLTAKKKPLPWWRLALVPAVILVLLLALLGGAWATRGKWMATYERWLGTREGQAIARLVPALAATSTPTKAPTLKPTASATRPAASATPSPTTAEVKQEATPTLAQVWETATPAPTPTPAPVLAVSDLPLIGTKVPGATAAMTKDSVRQIALWGIGGVNASAWSPDGKRIALGSSDGIFVYDAASFERLQFIQTGAWVEALSYDEKGSLLVAALRSGHVIAWDANTQAPMVDLSYTQNSGDVRLERIKDDTNSPAQAIAFSGNEHYLAIGYKNGALAVWNAQARGSKPEHLWDNYPTVTGLVFSPDNRYLYAANSNNELVVWDISTDKMSKKLPISSPVSELIISADGSLMLAGGVAGNVYLIDTTSEKVIHSFSFLGAPVTGLAISADNDLIGIGLGSGKVKVFRTPGGGEISSIQKELYTLDAHPDGLTSLAFSPDGETLATSSWKEGLLTWDPSSGKQKKALGLSMRQITRMVFSPDSQWLLVSDVENKTRAWSVRDGEVRYEYPGVLPAGKPFSKDGEYLVIAREAENTWTDGELDIVTLKDGKILQTIKGYRRGWLVSFSPDRNILVAGDTKTAYIWDTSTWEKLSMHGGSNDACSQFYTPDSQRLAVIWDAAVIFDYNQSIETLCATRADFAVPIFLSNNQRTAVYRMNNGLFWSYTMDSAQIAEAKNKSKFMVTHQPPDELLAVSDDDKLMAFAPKNERFLLGLADWSRVSFHGSYAYTQDQALTASYILALDWQPDFLYTAAISPQGQILATGSRFGTISLWGVP